MDRLDEHTPPPGPGGALPGQFVRFVTVGVASTVAYILLYLLAYSLDTAATSYAGANPSAGPALTAAAGGPAARGFRGSDPAISLAGFEKLVAQYEVHCYGGGGGGSDAAQIAAWVEAHFTAQTVGGMTVYNLTTGPSA